MKPRLVSKNKFLRWMNGSGVWDSLIHVRVGSDSAVQSGPSHQGVWGRWWNMWRIHTETDWHHMSGDHREIVCLCGWLGWTDICGKVGNEKLRFDVNCFWRIPMTWRVGHWWYCDTSLLFMISRYCTKYDSIWTTFTLFRSYLLLHKHSSTRLIAYHKLYKEYK